MLPVTATVSAESEPKNTLLRVDYQKVVSRADLTYSKRRRAETQVVLRRSRTLKGSLLRFETGKGERIAVLSDRAEDGPRRAVTPV